jgi:ABC-type Mn2+/Zn2+ transport system permease subunit
MNRKITNALIFILTILAAELAIEFVQHFLKIRTGVSNKYLLTLVGMGVIVAVFYPVFAFVHFLTEYFTTHFVKKTKQMTGNTFLGLLIAFFVGFGILFLIYLKNWYGITVW